MLRIAQEVFSGNKRLCLAITEPDAGSDVQGITTEAELTTDGKHYKLNGQKKVSFEGSTIPLPLTLLTRLTVDHW
jgi:alkylation response protein AidB-like acyl-CoA dehydrogenase